MGDAAEVRVVALPMLQVKRPEDHFRCTPLMSTIQASSCLGRQRKALEKPVGFGGNKDAYRVCRGCHIGEQIAHQVTEAVPEKLPELDERDREEMTQRPMLMVVPKEETKMLMNDQGETKPTRTKKRPTMKYPQQLRWREQREQRSLMAADVARGAGLPAPRISYLERGLSPATEEERAAIDRFFSSSGAKVAGDQPKKAKKAGKAAPKRSPKPRPDITGRRSGQVTRTKGESPKSTPAIDHPGRTQTEPMDQLVAEANRAAELLKVAMQGMAAELQRKATQIGESIRATTSGVAKLARVG